MRCPKCQKEMETGYLGSSEKGMLIWAEKKYFDNKLCNFFTKRDALKDFEKAERQDLIDLTNREIEILQEYLPKQLSRDEVKAEVQKIISEIGATSMKDMGAIMKEAKAKMGASAEGKTINEVAKEILKL